MTETHHSFICPPPNHRCDIYEEKTPSELQHLISGFIKFLESMNKLKRPSTQQRKSKVDSVSKDLTTGVSSGEASPRKSDVENRWVFFLFCVFQKNQTWHKNQACKHACLFFIDLLQTHVVYLAKTTHIYIFDLPITQKKCK